MRSALWNRVASAFVVAGLLGAVWTATAEAQTAGKIQGRVANAATGEPIAGAQVQVVGTNLGAITDDQGRYFINFVPAGVYDFQAQFIGYRTVTVTGQRVLAGQTTDINFQLEITAVEVEPLIVVGERNPLVPRDQISSKAIVSGELIDRLPLDNSQSIVLLQPGVINTNQGRTIRGSRPNEEAVFIDGVLIRRFSSGEAEPIELPTNALEQVSVTTGGAPARFGQGQSGVVQFVTRTGGPSYEGSLLLLTDALAPDSWRTNFNRLEASFGGPISRANNITFFLAGAAEGQRYAPANDGFRDVTIFVPQGTDQMFTLPRSSGAPNAADSVAVAFPNFVPWNNGRTFPFNPSDEYTFTSKVAWGFGTGSNVTLSYLREREQAIGLGILGNTSELFNPDGFDGTFSSSDVFTLSSYVLFAKTARQSLALDLHVNYQRHYDQTGELDPDWLLDHRDPGLGFNFSDMEFLVDTDDWPVTDRLVEAVRSGAMPPESLQVFPGRFDLAQSQSLPGIDEALRINPYGLRRNFPINGFAPTGANGGLEFREEETWSFNGTVDWQAGRYSRIQVGGEIASIDTRRQRVPLFAGTAVPALNEPVIAGAFFQYRLDLGDAVIEPGIRWDYFDPDGDFPRVPGFVFNVPDSLKADFVIAGAGEGPILDRVAPLRNCGLPDELAPGSEEARAQFPQLHRADGTFVCKPNFIAADTKSEFAPRLGVSFPVTDKSTFRLSYSQNVQVPAIQAQSFGGLGSAAGQVGLFSDQYADFQGGLANTNALFGRDIDMPRTTTFEAGYRQLFGEDLVFDVAIFSKTLRNGLAFRKLPFEDPNTPGQLIFINVLTNADFSQTRGVDLKIDKRFGQLADVSFNYSFIDARGTGSDPFTFTSLILRRNTNLSIITGEPVTPPDVLLPLEQNRRHNIAGTFSLLLPPDFQEGTPLGAIFSDVGVFALFRFASGLPFTRLENSANGQIGPPSLAGLGGIPIGDLNAANTPWEKRLDLRFTKGFRVGPQRVRAFADWRNPLDFKNTLQVFLETGATTNDGFREKLLNQHLQDPLLDGDAIIDDFVILDPVSGSIVECADNELNCFSLFRAEQRFGNGDGTFTVAEQRAAFGAWYDLMFGPQRFEESNQSIRFGFEILF